jgi:hypothetical protein
LSGFTADTQYKALTNSSESGLSQTVQAADLIVFIELLWGPRSHSSSGSLSTSSSSESEWLVSESLAAIMASASSSVAFTAFSAIARASSYTLRMTWIGLFPVSASCQAAHRATALGSPPDAPRTSAFRVW